MFPVNQIDHQFTVSSENGSRILAELRRELPGQSWNAVRRLLRSRRVAVNGVVCVDEGRVLSAGETVTLFTSPLPPPPDDGDVTICHVDELLVVAEKPSGMITVRRSSELAWPASRRRLQPTLDECVPRLIAQHAARRRGRKVRQRLPRLFPVHRIDRDTSGLVVFARSPEAQEHLIAQFADHQAVRRYRCVVPGQVPRQTIRSRLVRDRGDGRRGSTDEPNTGQDAVTHVRPLQRLGNYSELECSLETGRTNQIRIHLAELGHPVCGDIRYRGPLHKDIPDHSGAPRLALHAAELKVCHPATGKQLKFRTPWPPDMQTFLIRLSTESG